MMKIMKKGLLMLGAAAMMLASCTQNEVVEVAESRAIEFNTFVGKNTKAVNDLNETNKFTKFFIYGAFTKDQKTATVFDAAEATRTNDADQWSYPLEYWIEGGEYKFAAYSNGNAATTASFNETTGKLTIENYEVGTNDLILVDEVTATGAASGNTAVILTMKHLLSKVNFKFATTYASNLKVTVSQLTIHDAVNKGTHNDTWTPDTETKADKTYGNVVATATGVESEECYLLPQSNADLKASFTVTVTYEDGSIVAQKNFTDVFLASGNGDTWQEAYTYTYTANIKPENMNDGTVTSEPIVFTPSAGGWTEGSVADNDIINQ